MEAVLFDVGGVLVAHHGLKERAFAAFAVSDREHFWRLFNEAALPACRGEESLATCWQRMASILGHSLPEEVCRSLWVDDFREHIELDTGVLEIARSLAPRYKVGIVSNSLAEHSAILADMGVYDLFDPVVLSHEIGITKDDPRIFDLALERLGVPAEATVFIDDVPCFAETARGRGIYTILFRDAPTLRIELERMRFEIAGV